MSDLRLAFRCLRRTFVTTVAFVAGSTAIAADDAPVASPKTFVLAYGDCRDPDLISDARAFHRELEVYRESDMLPEAVLRAAQGELPQRSLAELKLKLTTAQSAFFEGQLNKARRQVEDVLAEVRLHAPSDERWRLTAETEATRYLVLKARGQTKDALVSFRNILRVAPMHHLDPSFFSPQTRDVFEEQRGMLAEERKGKLAVTSAPAEAAVYVDGALMGRTPLTLSLVPGTYAVQLERSGTASIARPAEVAVATPATLEFDLAFEGALSAERLPCIQGGGKPERFYEVSTKVGRLVGADEVVTLSLDKPRAGSGVLSATVVETNSGSRLRQGAIRVPSGKEAPEGLSDLARFVATGGRTQSLVANFERDSRGNFPNVQPTGLGAEQLTANSRIRVLNRPVIWGLAGASAVGLVSGIVLQAKSNASASEFNRAYAGQGPTLAQTGELSALRERSRSQSTWAKVALGGAALSAAAGVVTYMIGIPLGEEGAAALAVSPTSVGLTVPLP